ncbi:hypothetical protein G6F32_014165 [Rhizopus arrhizus]|nr:hypothetical protein G6F32_014165 [Rhizopus arrhizus]
MLPRFFHLLARYARNGEGQLGLDAETGRDLADAHLAGDGGVGRQRDLGLAGHELQRAQEAGRIAGREQLLRVGARAAGAAQLARGRQLDVQHVVGLDGTAFAAAGGGGLGGVQNLFDGHRDAPVRWVVLRWSLLCPVSKDAG